MKTFKEYSQKLDESGPYDDLGLRGLAAPGAPGGSTRGTGAHFGGVKPKKKTIQARTDALKDRIRSSLGTHKGFKEETELDEGIYLVGTYTNPDKDHIRVWQHSPAGFHYSIENTKNKKILTHHGSLESAVKKHSLTLNKEEYEPAPNVPSHIRAAANGNRGKSYNYLGRTHKYRTKKYEQDHDDEGAIEKAAARRKGLAW